MDINIIMESSRVFVKGLPPNIDEPDFRKHFSSGQITDIKLIPHRRIGYVGYHTHEDAARAVKLFNRSYIRMSKLGVELAKPVRYIGKNLPFSFLLMFTKAIRISAA